ncbi:hypothetical protein [Salipiger sp. PrR002]|uniref:hypothetical protein n=1 Tax=Salipiger sp. PrR002 TaxID=2706489 RepID=UPI0013BD9BFA|nr:hypothetical protein [Salipiger sp. PrR002]NDW01929.1 hypothetical protein [Salipiger sp. PrR002]NDW58993.1 hypothetical protein [Salipiger sp. PrR004]
MLNSILHSKAGRAGEEDRIFWRESFQTREDHITATFIERLSYLSGPTAMKLLREAARHDSADGAQLFAWKTAEFATVDFWPRWPAPDAGRTSV